MCLCVPLLKIRFPVDWRLLVEERIAKFGITIEVLRVFVVSMIFWVLKCFLIFGSLQTTLLCIMGELAGGGSVAVAVGVSDR